MARGSTLWLKIRAGRDRWTNVHGSDNQTCWISPCECRWCPSASCRLSLCLRKGVANGNMIITSMVSMRAQEMPTAQVIVPSFHTLQNDCSEIWLIWLIWLKIYCSFLYHLDLGKRFFCIFILESAQKAFCLKILLTSEKYIKANSWTVWFACFCTGFCILSAPGSEDSGTCMVQKGCSLDILRELDRA